MIDRKMIARAIEEFPWECAAQPHKRLYPLKLGSGLRTEPLPPLIPPFILDNKNLIGDTTPTL